MDFSQVKKSLVWLVEKINMHLPQMSGILCLVAQVKVRENEQQILTPVVQFA